MFGGQGNRGESGDWNRGTPGRAADEPESESKELEDGIKPLQVWKQVSDPER